MIDLRSDTFTLPSKEMMETIMHAKLGDDVWEEDPTVIELEALSAKIL
ncbi:MAG: beta-eliminating lyase-related protein, partial [Candidatus Heimdallarchaeaceae archaeon]